MFLFSDLVQNNIYYNYRFPSEPDIKKKWIETTGKKNWFPTKCSRICSVHFNEGSFKKTNKFRRLTTTAIPTIDVLKISNNDEVSGLTFGLIMAPFSQT